ncbi:hypothetical protein JTE90_011880 [Oedothorax gibbosus]|uniref:Zinc transporter ZIP1 n=1 Tax=Oedothorax gibbosus TaxID=931172 RepID=A0AAV6V444_9ARAC|nr:hypothetical protein JTE90_011880 [Oedothorax gibbosus]
MKLEYVKCVTSLGLFVVTFLMTMLPMALFRKRSSRCPPIPEEMSRTEGRERVMSFLNCFAAGVFLATCLLHLFPDVQEQMDRIFKELNIVPNYPVSEFLFGFGFLAILIVEQIITNCQEQNRDLMVPDDQQNLLQQDQTNENSSLATARSNNYGTIQDTEEVPQEDSPIVTFTPTVPRTTSALPQSSSVLRSFLLVLALSLHSVFEGLAIGLQTSIQSELKIFVAVLIHKCIIAFSLGTNLSGSQLQNASVIKGNLGFSLTSPLGILIGLIVVDFVHGIAMVITSGILQGLAAGTFLYITLFEVLPRELANGTDRMVKMACVVLGYSVVSLLLTFIPE